MAVTYLPTKSGQGYIVLCLSSDTKPTSTTPGALHETDTGIDWYPDGIGGWTAASGGSGITQLTGDVTAGPGSGSVAATIPNDTVTFAKMQNAAANTFIARAASSSGDLSEVALSASQLAGRGSTGDIAAIALGTGLSMSGATMSATGAVAADVQRCFRNGPVSGNGSKYVGVATNAAFNIASPSKFTVRLWWRAGLVQNNNGFITRSNLSSQQGDWALGILTGTTMRVGFTLNNAAVSTLSATVLTLGLWYFIEASYDSSLGSNNIKIFINGTLDTQANYSTVITNNAYSIAVGSYFDNAHCQQGYMSEVEFANGVIRNTSNYTPPQTITPDANTTILYTMNTYNGVTIPDSSGNGFNGTVVQGGTAEFLDTAQRYLPT